MKESGQVDDSQTNRLVKLLDWGDSMERQQKQFKEIYAMSYNEMLAKIEMLSHYEVMIANLKEQADKIRNSLKSEMVAQNTDTMVVGEYIIRYVDVLSNRFDSTAFKKVMPEVYKAYTKQVASRRFSISV